MHYQVYAQKRVIPQAVADKIAKKEAESQEGNLEAESQEGTEPQAQNNNNFKRKK